MNYKKLFGFGILIWAAVYLVASAFVAYKAMDQLWARIVVELALIVAAYLAARNLSLGSVKEIAKYSVSWAVIAVVLDLLLTVPFAGWEIFSQWDIYLGYLLIIVVPFFAAKKSAPIAQ